MPFTAAHPAIILPLLKIRRFRLSATGLITGSIAPDFEYFFRLETISGISHSATGLLVFNVPVSIVLALLFHLLVRDVVVEHLPPWFKARALAVPKPDWLRYLRKHWLLFLVSATLGAASHILWDGFTHSTAFVVTAFPVLNTPVPLFGVEVALCRILQHASTIIGLAVVWQYIRQSPAAAVPESSNGHGQWLYFWLKIFTLGVAFLLLNMALRYQALRLTDSIVTLISGWLLVLLVASFYRRFRSSPIPNDLI